MYVCIYMQAYACMHATVRAWRSEVNIWELLSASFIWYLGLKLSFQDWCRCHYTLSLLASPNGVLNVPAVSYQGRRHRQLCCRRAKPCLWILLPSPSSPILGGGEVWGIGSLFQKLHCEVLFSPQLPPKLSFGCFETASCSPGWPQISLCNWVLELWVFTTTPSLW